MSIISRSSCLHLLFLGQTSAKCLSLHWPVLVLTVHSLRVRKERIMMHALSGYSSPRYLNSSDIAPSGHILSLGRRPSNQSACYEPLLQLECSTCSFWSPCCFCTCFHSNKPRLLTSNCSYLFSSSFNYNIRL